MLGNESSDPGSTEIWFRFEDELHQKYVYSWFQHHWLLPYLSATLYILLVFGGRWWMKSRDRYTLRYPLALWNFSLALFSTIGAIRVCPRLLSTLSSEGFQNTVCDNSWKNDDIVTAWGFLFVLSKIPELGDTAFIVLRKQPLIFLHWYHHVSVIFFTWNTLSVFEAPGVWFAGMNYAVHSVMYSYYCLRALGFRVPRTTAMLVTILQITQMFMGTYITLHVLYTKTQTQQVCHVSPGYLTLSLVLYSSYVVLFANLFYKSYFARGGKFNTATVVANGHKPHTNGVVANGHKPQSNGLSNGYKPHMNGFKAKTA